VEVEVVGQPADENRHMLENMRTNGDGQCAVCGAFCPYSPGNPGWFIFKPPDFQVVAFPHNPSEELPVKDHSVIVVDGVFRADPGPLFYGVFLAEWMAVG